MLLGKASKKGLELGFRWWPTVAHPLLEGTEGRESIGKRGKDRVRRDFWETTEGRGSQSSLKRDEDRSAEVRLRRRHLQEMMKKREGNQARMLKSHSLTGCSC